MHDYYLLSLLPFWFLIFVQRAMEITTIPIRTMMNTTAIATIRGINTTLPVLPVRAPLTVGGSELIETEDEGVLSVFENVIYTVCKHELMTTDEGVIVAIVMGPDEGVIVAIVTGPFAVEC